MKPKILVVDDVETNLNLIQSILGKLDVDLITAHSGIDALSKIKDLEIAIALIDVRMPVMDGVELGRVIQDERSPVIVPIIFITAQVMDDTKLEEYYESGVVDYIIKPFSPKILKSKVKVFLELYNQKQQLREQHFLLEQSALELTRLNKTLKESNEFNKSLLQTIPFGMDVIDQDGKILFLSENLEKEYGNQAIGKKCWDFYCDYKDQCDQCPLKSEIVIGQNDVVEVQHFMGDKTYQISHAGMIFNGEKALLRIFQDISQRKIAQQSLSESEANFRAFFETISDLIVVATPEGRILFTNNAFRQKLGYSQDEISSMHVLDLNPPESREEANVIFAAMLNKERDSCPLSVITKSGVLVPAETRVWTGRWSGIDCIFGFIKDRSKEQEAHDLFERIFRKNPTIMALTLMPEQTFYDVNNAFLQVLGYSMQDVLGKSVTDLDLFLDPELQEDASYSLQKDGSFTNRELKVRRKDGIVLTGLFSGEIINMQGRQYYLTAMIDISERKRIQEELHISEKKYRQLVELAQEGIWSINSESRTTYVNPHMSIMLGYDVEEMIGVPIFHFMDKGGIDYASTKIEQRKDGISERHEFEFICKDGNRIYTSMATSPINSEEGDYLGAIALITDITESKRIEDELRRREQLYRSLFENMLNGFAYCQINLNNQDEPEDFTYLAVNMAFETLTGLKDVVGKRVSTVIPGIKESNPDIFEIYGRVAKGGQPERFETYIVPLQMWLWISVYCPGEGFFVAVFDVVTEQKLNEQRIIDSERMLNSIFENLPLMVFVKDAQNLRFLRLNKVGEDLLGLSKDNMIGKSDYDFFPKEEADFFVACDRKVLESKNLEDIPEEKIQTRFNGIRILHTKKIPIINSFGEAEFLLGISEDITVKKQVEDALKESERMYRTLLNASPEGIVILDMDEKIIEVSNITVEIFGAKNKNEFLGQDLFRFIPDNETEKLKDVLRKTLFEGLVQNVEFVLKTKTQVQFICELSTTLIQESDGRPKSYMAILRDISERKRIENQLIRTERLVSLGEMASAMAHEINQPLLSISLGIDNLLMKIQQSKSVDQTYFHNKSEKIFEDILRIGRIIDHVRAFSRDHDEFILSSFDINESINNAISMISEQFKHHGIGMSVKLDPNVHPIIGNTYRFEQVILNLLTNAKDALDEKTKSTNANFEKAITIRSYHDYKTNYVEIKDNGIGVSPQDIDRIMLPFYTTKEVGIGTGLGLSVSFGIIKELNGNIDIESKPNFGTLFRISLPIKQEKEKHLKNNSSSPKS